MRGVIVFLGPGVAGESERQRGGQQAEGEMDAHAHSSTRTSRIMPASMWYSRWQ